MKGDPALIVITIGLMIFAAAIALLLLGVLYVWFVYFTGLRLPRFIERALKLSELVDPGEQPRRIETLDPEQTQSQSETPTWHCPECDAKVVLVHYLPQREAEASIELALAREQGQERETEGMLTEQAGEERQPLQSTG